MLPNIKSKIHNNQERHQFKIDKKEMPLKVQGQLTLCLVSIGASNFENKNSDVLIGRNFLTLPSPSLIVISRSIKGRGVARLCT